jgi:hypothetical protein
LYPNEFFVGYFLFRGSKIPWVSWGDVCRPKKERGLGVKDLKSFNLSLLAKWREDEPQWKLVLEAKYSGVGRPFYLLVDLTRPLCGGVTW